MKSIWTLWLKIQKNCIIDSSSQSNVLNLSPILPSLVTSLTYSCPTVYKSDTSYWISDIAKTNIPCNSSLSMVTRLSYFHPFVGYMIIHFLDKFSIFISLPL